MLVMEFTEQAVVNTSEPSLTVKSLLLGVVDNPERPVVKPPHSPNDIIANDIGLNWPPLKPILIVLDPLGGSFKYQAPIR